MVKEPPWHCPSSAPAPQCAPGGSRQLGTPRVRPGHWVPSHGLGRGLSPPRGPQGRGRPRSRYRYTVDRTSPLCLGCERDPASRNRVCSVACDACSA
eukprot:scaffold119216_cov56-Phaeocystis_antarctica.AAC.1